MLQMVENGEIRYVTQTIEFRDYFEQIRITFRMSANVANLVLLHMLQFHCNLKLKEINSDCMVS